MSKKTVPPLLLWLVANQIASLLFLNIFRIPFGFFHGLHSKGAIDKLCVGGIRISSKKVWNTVHGCVCWILWKGMNGRSFKGKTGVVSRISRLLFSVD